MNTDTINHLLRYETRYKGAFPCDMIPDFTDQEYSVVVNTDNATKDGEHWTAVIVTRDIVYYFDSFGRHYNNKSFPDDYRLILRKLVSGKSLKYNDKVLQSFQSNTCAEFCIHFIKKFYEDVPFFSIFRNFTLDLCSNDKKVVSFVKHLQLL